MSQLFGLRSLHPATIAAFALGAVLVGVADLARTQGNPGQGGNDEPTPTTEVLPVMGGSATADSNGDMIAVTGVDVTGASVLYLVDTKRMRLAVYQASSTGSSQGVRLVGARRIELDMELDGFNDKSEYSYKELKAEFTKNGLLPDGSTAGKQ